MAKKMKSLSLFFSHTYKYIPSGDCLLKLAEDSLISADATTPLTKISSQLRSQSITKSNNWVQISPEPNPKVLHRLFLPFFLPQKQHNHFLFTFTIPPMQYLKSAKVPFLFKDFNFIQS